MVFPSYHGASTVNIYCLIEEYDEIANELPSPGHCYKRVVNSPPPQLTSPALMVRVVKATAIRRCLCCHGQQNPTHQTSAIIIVSKRVDDSRKKMDFSFAPFTFLPLLCVSFPCRNCKLMVTLNYLSMYYCFCSVKLCWQ